MCTSVHISFSHQRQSGLSPSSVCSSLHPPLHRPPNAIRSVESWLPLMTKTFKANQKIVKKLHRFGGKYRFVIHIACDNNPFRLFFIDDIDDCCEDVFLILFQRKRNEISCFHNISQRVSRHDTPKPYSIPAHMLRCNTIRLSLSY